MKDLHNKSNIAQKPKTGFAEETNSSLIKRWEKYPTSAGRTHYLRHLKGEKLTYREACLAQCAECNCGWIDGRHDCNVPQPNLKTAKLKQAVQAYKQLGFKLNLVEIAAFAGISTRNAHNQKSNIYRYWSDNNTMSNTDKLFALNRSLKLALANVQNLEEAFGAILGIYLKAETDILNNTNSLRNVKKLGEQITKIYRLVCNYKNTKGVPVHSGNKSAKYLLTSKIKLDKLFTRSKSYSNGKCAKRWQATDLLKQHVQISINKLLDIISDNDAYGCVYLSPHMFAKNNAKSTQNNIIYGSRLEQHTKSVL